MVLQTGAYNWSTSVDYHIDHGLVAVLQTLFRNVEVVEFGAGSGRYASALRNKTARYEAFDGAPNVAERTFGLVKYLDLTTPKKDIRRSDWVMCLEVIEHIPAQFEERVITFLKRTAKFGIIVSWARPLQKKQAHVNTRSILHVLSTFEGSDFEVDVALTLCLREVSTFTWFQRNIVVFKRRALHWSSQMRYLASTRALALSRSKRFSESDH
jgi:hypothetical protein